MSLFSSASGMDLAWIKVGRANPMSAKARRILASSKCEKEPKLVPGSTRASSAISRGYVCGGRRVWGPIGLEERRGDENRLSEISDANFVLDHFPQVHRNFG